MDQKILDAVAVYVDATAKMADPPLLVTIYVREHEHHAGRVLTNGKAVVDEGHLVGVGAEIVRGVG